MSHVTVWCHTVWQYDVTQHDSTMSHCVTVRCHTVKHAVEDAATKPVKCCSKYNYDERLKRQKCEVSLTQQTAAVLPGSTSLASLPRTWYASLGPSSASSATVHKYHACWECCKSHSPACQALKINVANIFTLKTDTGMNIQYLPTSSHETVLVPTHVIPIPTPSPSILWPSSSSSHTNPTPNNPYIVNCNILL